MTTKPSDVPGARTTMYARQLTIGAARPRVFDAIATLDGPRHWWTTVVTGSAAAGGELRFGFAGLDEQIVMRVDALRPPADDPASPQTTARRACDVARPYLGSCTADETVDGGLILPRGLIDTRGASRGGRQPPGDYRRAVGRDRAEVQLQRHLERGRISDEVMSQNRGDSLAARQSLLGSAPRRGVELTESRRLSCAVSRLPSPGPSIPQGAVR